MIILIAFVLILILFTILQSWANASLSEIVVRSVCKCIFFFKSRKTGRPQPPKKKKYRFSALDTFYYTSLSLMYIYSWDSIGEFVFQSRNKTQGIVGDRFPFDIRCTGLCGKIPGKMPGKIIGFKFGICRHRNFPGRHRASGFFVTKTGQIRCCRSFL